MITSPSRAQTALLTLMVLLARPEMSSAAERHDALSPRVYKSGAAGLCFQRIYDTQHLRRHPRQTISGATVLVRRDVDPPAGVRSFELLTRFQLRDGSDPLYGMSSCWLEPNANQAQNGVRPAPAIRSDDAIQCMSSVEPDSSEEAGDFLLDPAQAGRRLVLNNGFSQMRTGPHGARAMRDVTFGTADAVLRLDQVDGKHCAGLPDVLAEPVRPQNR